MKSSVIGPRRLRWLLNLYPPLLLQRIRVVEFSEDFRRCRVRLGKSILTRNLYGTTFGGSIYSAADPFFPILYWQILAREGRLLQAWLRASKADFLKPAASALTLDFEISDEKLESARSQLEEKGRAVMTDTVEGIDREGHCCARIELVSILRPPPEGEEPARVF
ncbi:MAG TPA: DUF4442 domain-containing protein [Planctomycetes bacterium]|nr:DUF4442 domain-containing protein [Planctomycetota bacterium]HIN81073.1 DUF4442 domain-containing protein [Planctomycetota bacterium]